MESFDRFLKRHANRSSTAFTGAIQGGNKGVVNLFPLPKDISREKGLHFQLYKCRFAALAGLTEQEVEALMPTSHKDWEYGYEYPDMGGFEGFNRTRKEIDRLADALSRRD